MGGMERTWKLSQAPPRRRKIPLRIIRNHAQKISKFQPPIEEQNKRIQVFLKKFDEKLPKTVIRIQVDEIRQLARDLFAEGAYLEVINHYNQAAFTLLKFGFPDEALSFSNDAKVLQQLVEARKMKIEVLAGALEHRDIPMIQTIYEDLIELSQKLNDISAVDRYQSQLERLQQSNYDLQVLNPVQGTGWLPVFDEEKDLISSNDFKIDQLKQMQLTIDQRAHEMEGRTLLKAAAYLYKHCKQISSQLVEMGLEFEGANVDRYQREQDRCAKKAIMREVDKLTKLRRII